MNRVRRLIDLALSTDEVPEVVTFGCLVVFMLTIAVLAGVTH